MKKNSGKIAIFRCLVFFAPLEAKMMKNDLKKKYDKKMIKKMIKNQRKIAIFIF